MSILGRIEKRQADGNDETALPIGHVTIYGNITCLIEPTSGFGICGKAG